MNRMRMQRMGQRRPRGMTMLVVLVLLSVMLLGALSLARLTAVGSLAAGNVSAKERALQVSQIGVNEAYAATLALADPATPQGPWYYAAALPLDASGLPTGSTLESQAPQLQVDGHDVRWVVERLCDAASVSDPARQCLLRQDRPLIENANAGSEAPDAPAGTQYRITVSVTGPRGTRSVVQVLMTRG